MLKQHNDIDMCSGPVLGNVFRFTIPIMLSSVLQLLFNAADLIVIGNFRGSNSVGAVGATSSLVTLFINFFLGASVGVGVVVANGLGAKSGRDVSRAVHTGIPLAAIIGAFISCVGLFFSRDFLTVMDTPEEIIDLSTIYLKIYLCGAIPSMLYNFGAAILRAAGNTKGPLAYLTIAGVANVILNIVFVTVFGMDVEGVAIATVISQIISAVLTLIALCKRTDACRLTVRKLRLYGDSLKKILSIGLPSGIQSSMFNIANVLVQSSINSLGNSLGAYIVSGDSAANNICSFVYTGMNAYQQAAVNFAGQNIGAGKFDRIKEIRKSCFIGVVVTWFTLFSLIYLFREPLLGLYITDNPKAIEIGVIRMIWVCLPYVLCGLMDTITGLMRGCGASFVSMVISVVGVCAVRLAWLFIAFPMPQFHNLQGIYFCYGLSWAITLAVDLMVFPFVFKKVKRKYDKT